MLQLYPRNQVDFKWNGDPIRHSYDEHVIRDEEWYLKFKVLLDKGEEYKKIKKGMVIKAWTLDGEQPFRVWDIVKHANYVEIEALHILYDLDTKMTDPVYVNNGGLSGALAQFKSGLPSEMGPFEFSTGITRQRTYNTANADEADDKYNALEVFLDGAHSIVGTWEAELLINGWDIRLVESIGSRTGALLYEKKNIASFEDEQSNKSLVTRIYAQSTYMPERDPNAEEEPEEVHISVTVDSPLIGEYEQVHERLYVNNDARTEQELIDWARRKFIYEKMDLPRRSIKVETNIIDGTEIKYGDYIVLKYLAHDVDEEIRCVGYDVNPVSKDVIDITLGSTVTTVGGAINDTIQDLTEGQLSNEMKKIAERVTKIVMSANGFNRTAYGPEPVPNPIDGDLWYDFQFDTPNIVAVKIWKDGRWVIIVDDFTGERIKEDIEEVKDRAEALEGEAERLSGEIDTAIDTAGGAVNLAEAAELIAKQAQEDVLGIGDAVDTANNNAQTAIDTATDAFNDVQLVKDEAKKAMQDAQTAVGTSASALSEAQLALQEAQSAKGDAGTAIQDAQIAKNDAQTAIQQAQSAKNTADDARDKANAIPQTINQTIIDRGLVAGTTVEQWIDDAAGELGLAISDVSGQIPIFTMGVVWDKESDPTLKRTDYLQEYTDLEDFELLSSDYQVTKSGFSGDITDLKTNKLDSGTFTEFKTNEFDANVSGFEGRITDVESNKLDGSAFDSFKANEYDLTVDGFTSNIESLQTGKLGSAEFDSFKSNEYQVAVDGITSNIESLQTEKLDGNEFEEFKTNEFEVTVDGFRQSIEHIDSVVPNVIMGVTWDKESDSSLIRTGYTQDSIDPIDFERFTAQYELDIDGFSSTLSEVQSKQNGKLDSAIFNTFKTSEFDVAVDGLRGSITDLETEKLDEIEFSEFKSNDYQITVDGFRSSLQSVSGQIPSLVLGVTWGKASTPTMTRTDYTSNTVDTEEFEIHQADYSQTIDGINSSLSSKLDSDIFNTFKTNEYTVTVDGMSGSISALEENKLDSNTFSSFKSNDYDVTVSGFNNKISSLESGKLDGIDFNEFKENDYGVTVDGLRMDLTAVSGNLPIHVMGVRWDKTSDPNLYRTDESGNVGDYEYAQQTAQFNNTITGLSGDITSLNTNKLDNTEFNNFKSNTYAVDIDGIQSNITTLDSEKLDGTEFNNFKSNVYEVDVDGIRSNITTLTEDKLDTGTFNNFKSNTFDVSINGLQGSINTLNSSKLDETDFDTFKQNDYQVTVDGLEMNILSMSGTAPTVIMGVEWDKSSGPTLERTDSSIGYTGSDEFELLSADYTATKDNWSSRLVQIETAGYATQQWSNETFATPQQITQTLTSYAKNTDLNGLATEQFATNIATQKANAVSQSLSAYAKSTDLNGLASESWTTSQISASATTINSAITDIKTKPGETITGFSDVKQTVDLYQVVIGDTRNDIATNVTQLVLTDEAFKVNINDAMTLKMNEDIFQVKSYSEVAGENNLIDNTHFELPSTLLARDEVRPVILGKDAGITVMVNESIISRYMNISSSDINTHNQLTFELNSPVTPILPIYISVMGIGKARFRLKNSEWTEFKVIHSDNPTMFTIPTMNGSAHYELTMEIAEDTMIYSDTLMVSRTISPYRDSRDNRSSAEITQIAGSTTIKNDLIHLDGNVLMDKAWITDLMVDKIEARHVEAYMGTFGELVANNINVNQLTGNHMNFITGAFSGANGDMLIDAYGITIDSDERWDLEIDYGGMSIYSRDTGRQMAVIKGYNDRGTGEEDGMAMIAENGYEISLGRRTSGNVFSSVLTVTNPGYNRIDLNAPLYPDGNAYGLRIQNGSIDGVQGLKLTATSSSNGIYIAGGEIFFSTSRGYYGASWIVDQIFSLWNRVNNL